MELHRYPDEKPGKAPKFYLVDMGYWEVIQWTGKRWVYWSDYSDCYCYPDKDVKYWAELPEIPEKK